MGAVCGDEISDIVPFRYFIRKCGLSLTPIRTIARGPMPPHTSTAIDKERKQLFATFRDRIVRIISDSTKNGILL